MQLESAAPNSFRQMSNEYRRLQSSIGRQSFGETPILQMMYNELRRPQSYIKAQSTREQMLSQATKTAMFSAMPMTLDQIVEETRQLPTDVVAELVERILLARHGGIEPGVASAWKSEIDRRTNEIEAGKVQGIPVEESLARIRKIVER